MGTLSSFKNGLLDVLERVSKNYHAIIAELGWVNQLRPFLDPRSAERPSVKILSLQSKFYLNIALRTFF